MVCIAGYTSQSDIYPFHSQRDDIFRSSGIKDIGTEAETFGNTMTG